MKLGERRFFLVLCSLSPPKLHATACLYFKASSFLFLAYPRFSPMNFSINSRRPVEIEGEEAEAHDESDINRKSNASAATEQQHFFGISYFNYREVTFFSRVDSFDSFSEHET